MSGLIFLIAVLSALLTLWLAFPRRVKAGVLNDMYTLESAKSMLAKQPALADGVKQVDDALAIIGGFGAIVDWMGEAGVAVTVDGDKVAGGMTFADALERHKRVFPQLVIQLARAGEVSGQLPEVLKEVVRSLKWQDEMAAQTKKLLL